MARKAVTEFIVLPPDDADDDHGRIKAHLGEAFPGYKFTTVPGMPLASDEFQVIPVMGTVGGGEVADEVGGMCEEPERWLLDDIVQVCRRFDVTTAKRRAS